jgi:hypothetical protein
VRLLPEDRCQEFVQQSSDSSDSEEGLCCMQLVQLFVKMLVKCSANLPIFS